MVDSSVTKAQTGVSVINIITIPHVKKELLMSTSQQLGQCSHLKGTYWYNYLFQKGSHYTARAGLKVESPAQLLGCWTVGVHHHTTQLLHSPEVILDDSHDNTPLEKKNKNKETTNQVSLWSLSWLFHYSEPRQAFNHLQSLYVSLLSPGLQHGPPMLASVHFPCFKCEHRSPKQACWGQSGTTQRSGVYMPGDL